ncbi:type IV secretion protein Rhs [Salmonella enterica subsp. enterica serovar Tennessee]|uniref:Type IV secretion protein Rhs n=3 Tax=Salmonella enterica TaxID=28901 RepID=A0A5T2U3C5_SALER|nr:hypothetical protein AH83_008610 [Salmonella enterica subsp. enterica serovar Tennessee]AXD24021.1 type IV secretion protein Rhs [Salmonella enterica]AZI77967.1 type IV secretion protein Rhs [Salmonella enterica subsp. enterica serovar Montevideo]EAW4934347.1 type IV secretion protein Rhs [Salmonella enterica subsp. enterica]EAY0471836.1 type IV secretion protein Rhs [Salmonella enterica subsp. enterica serovar Rissen]EBH9672165.1 type IV secretion protein Rhs [Salmonella enterica subsp. en
MSGKPAARQNDMTAKGGPIVQGSAGVLRGAPINPLPGAKVLPGEIDFTPPGPRPFILTRA